VVRRIVLSVLVAGSLVGLVFGLSSARRPPSGETSAVQQVMPPPGDLDLRQVTVGVKLATGYTGDLFVDGVQVPEDELHREPALYQITLQPRPGGQFNLGPGRHCADVRYWRLAQPDDKRDSPQWCFNLH
jgi:hypothetical protein